MNGYSAGSGPLGSGPTGPGSGFSVMPRCRYLSESFLTRLFDLIHKSNVLSYIALLQVTRTAAFGGICVLCYLEIN